MLRLQSTSNSYEKSQDNAWHRDYSKLTRLDEAMRFTVRRGEAGQSYAQRGTMKRGEARHDKVRRDEVRYGVERGQRRGET